MKGTKESSADYQKLREMVKDIDFCMLTTVDENNDLHSRPMSLNSEVDQEGNLWFFTSANSHKVTEVSRTPKCNVSFANPDDNRYVSITGTAELVREKRKIEELWKPELKAWFPKGTDEPDLALLRVGIEKAEYWDNPSSKVAQVVSFVSAIISGERADSGENKKIDLR
ncbi:MAG: pyridoxamine 5'-phosphate oxidase family protein [Pyrinomonadaceae bacterium]